MEKKLMVQREPFTHEGKEYFSYFVTGQIRGKEMRIKLVPPDRGGYKVLDLVFGDEMKVELSSKPYEIKDAKTGRTTKGNTYFVSSVDESGQVLKGAIKPYQSSDKNLLELLVK